MILGELEPSWLAQVTGGKLNPGAQTAHDLSWDSRQVGPGSAFIALAGEQTHGELFVAEALERGAALVISERPHPRGLQVADTWQALADLATALRQNYPGHLVAVTGSAGKTTTKEALAQGLGFAAPYGNQNTLPALARFLLGTGNQTGLALELGIDRPGEMDLLAAVTRPDLGIISAIGPAHLERLGSVAGVAREKEKLLAASRVKLASLAALPYLNISGVKSYGLGAGDFSAQNYEPGLEASSFSYAGLKVRVPYPGAGAALAALAALASAEILGQDLGPVAERLAELKLPAGRLERREKNGVVYLNDSYNANPISVQNGLELLAKIPGPKIAVLGEMRELGENSRQYHLEAARQASQAAQTVIFLGPYAHEQAALSGGIAAADLAEVRQLLEQAQPGVTVYLKASRAVGLEKVLDD